VEFAQQKEAEMNLVDVLKYGDTFLLGVLASVPQTEWNRPGVCGHWSVREILAHVGSYEELLVDLLRDFSGGVPGPLLDEFFQDPTGFNDLQVAQRAGMSSQEVQAEYDAAHVAAMRLAATIPAERARQVGTLPWYGEEYALDDFVVYMYYGHKREHGAQVAVFHDRLVSEGALI
jgi:hypothetical protein